MLRLCNIFCIFVFLLFCVLSPTCLLPQPNTLQMQYTAFIHHTRIHRSMNASPCCWLSFFSFLLHVLESFTCVFFVFFSFLFSLFFVFAFVLSSIFVSRIRFAWNTQFNSIGRHCSPIQMFFRFQPIFWFFVAKNTSWRIEGIRSATTTITTKENEIIASIFATKRIRSLRILIHFQRFRTPKRKTILDRAGLYAYARVFVLNVDDFTYLLISFFFLYICKMKT